MGSVGFALLGGLAVAFALGCSRSDDVAPYAAEVARREAFARATLEDAGAGRALSVSSRLDVQFGTGFGPLSYELDEKDGHPSFTNHAFRWMGQNAHVRLKKHGKKAMRLLIVGWMHHKVVGTRPTIHVYIDGFHIASSPPIGKDGHYWIETTVPERVLLREWVDLTIRTTAVGFHWSDPPQLKVLNVYTFGWFEAN